MSVNEHVLTEKAEFKKGISFGWKVDVVYQCLINF